MSKRQDGRRRLWDRIGGFAIGCALVCGAGRASGQDPTAGRGPLQDLNEARERFLNIAPESESFDVLLITLGAVPPEKLGCYGRREKNLTPAIDAFAKDAFRFDNAFAVSPHPQMAALTLLHSCYPATLHEIGSTSHVQSITSQFSDRGFVCFGFYPRDLVLPSDESPLAIANENLDFDRALRSWSRLRDRAVEIMKRGYDDRRGVQPVFGWIHLAYPEPPARYHPGIELGRAPEDHYDAALRYSDGAIDAVLEELERREASQRTIVVIAATHGLSEMPARTPWYESRLSDASLRVPLLISVPGVKGRVVDDLVETIDVAPTLLSLLGRTCDYSVQGRSLLPLLLPDAKSDDGMAAAELLPLATQAPSLRRVSLRTREWRLEGNPTTGTYQLRKPGQAADVAAANPDVVARLSGLLDSISIYNSAAAKLWRGGDYGPFAMTPEIALAARAEWLVDREDPRARGAVLDLLQGSSEDNLSAVRLLMRVGQAEDAERVRPFLDHEDFRVQALAGAYVARYGQVELGLDHAMHGLRPELPPAYLEDLVSALGLTGSSAAREALLAFKPKARSRSLDGPRNPVLAARDLALARLGDPVAQGKLSTYILFPNASYEKEPFVAALSGLRGADSVPLLKLCLTDGDRASSTVLAVLDAIAKFGDATAGRAVATAINHPDRTVRARAATILREWGSLEAYSSLVGLLSGDPEPVEFATRELLRSTSLIGSPLLPGERLDRWLMRNPKAEAEDGYPLIGRDGITISVRVPSTAYRLCAVAYRAKRGEEPRQLADAELFVNVNDQTSRLSTLQVTQKEGIWIWIGALTDQSLEDGTNRFQIRLRDRERRDAEATALAFVLLPYDANVFVPLAGINTRALLTPNEHAGATATLRGDLNRYRLWYAATAPAPIASGRLSVALQGKSLVDERIEGDHRTATINVDTPPSLGRGDRLALRFEAPQATPGVVVTAVVYGVR